MVTNEMDFENRIVIHDFPARTAMWNILYFSDIKWSISDGKKRRKTCRCSSRRLAAGEHWTMCCSTARPVWARPPHQYHRQ